MSNFETDSLVSRIEKLELRQQILAKHIIQVKRQLNSCSKQFNNQQFTSLQDALNQLQQQLDEHSMQALSVMSVNEPTEESSCQEKSALTVMNYEELKTNREPENCYEGSQEPPIDTKEFLSRYKNKERDFAGINLSGANLCGANLSEVNLSSSNLKGANLNRVNLLIARLNGVNLQGADISEANLTNANLEGANLDNADIQQARVYQTNFTKAKLKKANLSGVDLNSADLRGADLCGANLSRVSMSSQTNLGGANLSATNLTGAYLRAVRLMKIDFRNANLSNATLLGANFVGADFQSVKLTGGKSSEELNCRRATVKKLTQIRFQNKIKY